MSQFHLFATDVQLASRREESNDPRRSDYIHLPDRTIIITLVRVAGEMEVKAT